jgi:hypothetical protein
MGLVGEEAIEKSRTGTWTAYNCSPSSLHVMSPVSYGPILRTYLIAGDPLGKGYESFHFFLELGNYLLPDPINN